MGIRCVALRVVFGGSLLVSVVGCAPMVGTSSKQAVVRPKVVPVVVKKAVDYMAIGPRRLLAAVEPLLVHREKQGLLVERLALEEVIPSTEDQEDATAPILAAIRASAAASGKRLRFILLVGDAPGYNELDSERNLLPTFYQRKVQYWDDDPFDRARMAVPSLRERRRVRYEGSEYATDLPYAQGHIDAPGQPQFAAKVNPRLLAVGRIPARLPEEAANFARKVIGYETSKSEGMWRRSMSIFTGPANFGALADFMIESSMTRTLDEKVPYDWDVDVVFPKIGSPWAYPFPDLQNKLIERLEAGALIAGYVGHGAPTHFDDVRHNYNYYQIGTVWDLERLRIGDGKPFFIALTCSNGFFDLRERMQSVAEVLVMNPGGAIAAFASSRVSHPYPNALYGDAIVQTFVNERASTIGEGIVIAKERMLEGELPLAPLLFDSDPRELAEEHVGLYNLLGDPATILQYPARARMTLDGLKENVTPGSSVDVKVDIEGIAVGKAILTVETKRSVIRTKVPSAIALRQMAEHEMWETMRATYNAAADKVVSREEQAVASGKAVFHVKLPDAEGEYVLKVFATGGGETSGGYVRVKVAKPRFEGVE
jgi:Peptidase family C25